MSRKFSVKGNDNTITGDGCSFTSKNNGEYSVNFKLDKCGTTVTQNGDKIVFSNSVTGNTDALTIQDRVLIVLSQNPTFDDLSDDPKSSAHTKSQTGSTP